MVKKGHLLEDREKVEEEDERKGEECEEEDVRGLIGTRFRIRFLNPVFLI